MFDILIPIQSHALKNFNDRLKDKTKIPSYNVNMVSFSSGVVLQRIFISDFFFPRLKLRKFVTRKSLAVFSSLKKKKRKEIRFKEVSWFAYERLWKRKNEFTRRKYLMKVTHNHHMDRLFSYIIKWLVLLLLFVSPKFFLHSHRIACNL